MGRAEGCGPAESGCARPGLRWSDASPSPCPSRPRCRHRRNPRRARAAPRAPQRAAQPGAADDQRIRPARHGAGVQPWADRAGAGLVWRAAGVVESRANEARWPWRRGLAAVVRGAARRGLFPQAQLVGRPVDGRQHSPGRQPGRLRQPAHSRHRDRPGAPQTKRPSEVDGRLRGAIPALLWGDRGRVRAATGDRHPLVAHHSAGPDRAGSGHLRGRHHLRAGLVGGVACR